MSYKVNLSPAFQRDLDDIWSYIAEELMNPNAANRIIENIIDTTQTPEAFPLSGKRLFLTGGMDSGFRFPVFEDYIIIYRVLSDSVQVARAVHSSLDYMRVVFPWYRKKSFDEDD